MPPGRQVIIRDWINAYHVVFEDDKQSELEDSGDGRDADIALVAGVCGSVLRALRIQRFHRTGRHDEPGRHGWLTAA